MQQAKFLTINAASEMLERNRRTVTKALRDVAPDMKDDQGRERWKLSTIVHALAVLDRAGARVGAATRTGGQRASLDEIERLGVVLERGIDRLRAEPSIEKRRVLVREIGPDVSALNRAFDRDSESWPEHERPILKVYCDTVISGVIGELMHLCKYELAEASHAR